MTINDRRLMESFDSDSPSDIVFWAFRYFIGRKTIAACCFAEGMAKGWKFLSQHVQYLIKRELEEEFRRDDIARKSGVKMYRPLGADCDRRAWERVRAAYGGGK